MISHELYGLFDLAAIVLVGIGVFLCWWNRKSCSTIMKADSTPVGLSKVDDAAPEKIDN